MSNAGLSVMIGAGAIVLLVALVAIIKSRYKIFTSREFVLYFRRGTLRTKGYGGGYFLLPIIDEIVILSTTVQKLEVDIAEKIITKENQDLRVSGFILYKIQEPEIAYQAISGSQDHGVLHELNKTLEDLVESIVRTTVASLTLDQVLRERALIIEAIMEDMLPVVNPMGIEISTAEIRHVEVLDTKLFQDLQEDYRQDARLKAEQTKIQTDREVAKSKAIAHQEIRQQELERDRLVLLNEQQVQETDEKRRIAVESLQKQREAKVAELDKKKLEIEAQTSLMQIELEAESNKRRKLLEQIDIEAEQKKRMAEADAAAIRLAAQARKDAAELDAEAEAVKLRKVAQAKKESLLAEADGRKALLLAEAEGLREKVKAQGYVNESMIMQELVKQLPQIASSMKVGDINWLNMGGNGSGTENSPLGIIPKNLLEIMTLSKSFGLDVEGLVKSIRGKEGKTSNGLHPKLNSTSTLNVGPVVYTHDELVAATAIYDNDESLTGFDIDGDGDIDFMLPAGLHLILDDDGHISGFDLTGDGKEDYSIKTFQDMSAIDSNGDGMINGLSLNGDNDIDINISDLAQLI